MSHANTASRLFLAILALILAIITGGLLINNMTIAASLTLITALGLGWAALDLNDSSQNNDKTGLFADTIETIGPVYDIEARLIEALPDPALIVDINGLVTTENAAAKKLLGPMSVNDPIELYLRHPAALEALKESLISGKPEERDVVMLSPSERFYQVRSAPVGTENNLRLLTMRDQTNARLAERMRMDFVANASHELRTPLATLVGFIETLQGAAADDGAARVRFLKIMAGEANRMERLIEDLLSLSRIEMDKFMRPTFQLMLPPLLGEVVATLAMRLDLEERQILTQIDSDLPMVIADRDQILQVLHNLISNALKYGRPGTPIHITARHDPVTTMVHVAVADQGDGISAEHLPRLTERFYRVDTARSRSLGGTGLGLAIVKHIVERHRGELQITSQQAIGTTVEITLPTLK